MRWKETAVTEHTGRIETHEKTAEEKAAEVRALMDETFGEVMGRSPNANQ